MAYFSSPKNNSAEMNFSASFRVQGHCLEWNIVLPSYRKENKSKIWKMIEACIRDECIIVLF